MRLPFLKDCRCFPDDPQKLTQEHKYQQLQGIPPQISMQLRVLFIKTALKNT
jgi:hypothetical protein